MPTKRTLLVLGASSDQLHLVRTAQAMGLAVLCVDGDPDAPGLAEADACGVVSTRDVPALLAFLERRRIDGVLTMGSDIPDVVAAIAAARGLPGPSAETARLATDKLAMKQRFAQVRVPIPWFAEVRTLGELRAHLAERRKLVLKPIDRSGSRGVFVLDGSHDPAELLRVARDFSFSGRVMVEEHLDGPQISTETILFDGRAATPGFADRNYELAARFHPQVMENGGLVPSRFAGAERRAIEDVVVAAARALGIERGVAKGDVVWTTEGAKVIEIAARLSGGDFCESLVPLSTAAGRGAGVSYVRDAIRIALGEEPRWDELDAPVLRHVANRYLFPPAGRLVAVEGVERVRAQPWVKKLELRFRPGDVVPPATSHATRAGVFVVVADDAEALARRIDWVYRTLRLVVEPEPARASA